MIFPTVENIVELNKEYIENFGGTFVPPNNFRYCDSLVWVLDAIQYSMFGVMKYRTFSSKAALLTWTIINNHVFNDGNKRTGFASLIHFSKANGYSLGKLKGQEIKDLCIRIAEYRFNGFSLEKFDDWIVSKLLE